MQLLAIIPASFSKVQILHHIPSSTKLMVDKTRNLKAAKGVLRKVDSYYGHHVNVANVHIPQSSYLEVERDCFRQSVGKKEVEEFR